MKNFSRELIIAISIVVVLNFLISLIDIEKYTEFTILNNLVSAILGVISITVIALSINFFRGKLSIWGYVWRTYLVNTLSLVPVTICLIVIFKNITPSLGYSMIYITLTTIFAVILAWLFHSVARREHLQRITMFFSGH